MLSDMIFPKFKLIFGEDVIKIWLHLFLKLFAYSTPTTQKLVYLNTLGKLGIMLTRL